MNRWALLALVLAAPIQAQRIPEHAISIGVERVFADFSGEGFAFLVLRHTALGTGDGPAMEFGVGLLPATSAPVMPFGFEIGPVLTAGRFPMLHVRAGLTLVMLVLPGAYVGGSMTIPIADPIAIRFDGTYRLFFAGHETAGLSSFAVGLSFFTGSRPAAPPPRCDCEEDERP